LIHSLPPTSTLFPYTTLFRSRRIDLAQEVDQAAVGLVDLQVVVLVAAHRLVEELSGEPAALVEEQVAQGVVAPGELAIDLAHHLDRKSTRLNSSHLGISYAVF